MRRLRWALVAAILATAAALAPRFPAPAAEAQSRPAPSIDVYFSPNGGIQDRLLKEFNLCKESVEICVFDISSGPLGQAIIEARKRGRAIRVITDAREAKGKQSEVDALKKAGILVTTVGGWGSLMHNKFALFDHALVVTGSYNWSNGAEERNRENALFIKDSEVAGKYREEFERLWEGKK
ncbi:MAG: phospholipase D family protein [Planctomycetes bacterium]|nr:phospholipase D family protein [Planctomycetota bacterium]